MLRECYDFVTFDFGFSEPKIAFRPYGTGLSGASPFLISGMRFLQEFANGSKRGLQQHAGTVPAPQGQDARYAGEDASAGTVPAGEMHGWRESANAGTVPAFHASTM